MSRFSNKQLAMVAVICVILIGATSGFFYKKSIELKYAKAIDICVVDAKLGATEIKSLDAKYGRWPLSAMDNNMAVFCMVAGL